MAKKKKSMGVGSLLLLAIVVFGIAGAGSYYFIRWYNSNTMAPTVEKTTPTPPNVTITETKNLVIYLPKTTRGKVYLAPITRSIEPKGDILDAAMEALIAANNEAGDKGPLPKGTNVRGPVDLKHGVAAVDMSKEFIDNFDGGIDRESIAINSIVHTIVNNSDGKVKSVRILVEGKTADTLGGHFDLSEPIEPDDTLLKRPGK